MTSNLDAIAPPMADAGAAARRIGAGQPRRPRAAALLAAAAPVAAAVVALAGPALAAPAPAAGPAGAPHARTTLAGDDPCIVAAHSRALNTLKLPNCAGD